MSPKRRTPLACGFCRHALSVIGMQIELRCGGLLADASGGKDEAGGLRDAYRRPCCFERMFTLTAFDRFAKRSDCRCHEYQRGKCEVSGRFWRQS